MLLAPLTSKETPFINIYTKEERGMERGKEGRKENRREEGGRREMS